MGKTCIFSTHILLLPYKGNLNYSKLSFSNFKRYADYHGYDFLGNTTPNPKYFIHNGYDDSPKGRYPYVYQLYQINLLLERYDKIFFIASDMLITKQFGSLDEEFGNNDYCADTLQYHSKHLIRLVKLSKFTEESKSYIIQKLGLNYNYYFPNSFMISNKALGLYDILIFRSRFGHISNKELGYPHTNNDLQLLRFILFTKDVKLITNDYQERKQFHYNEEVLKHWHNYTQYPHSLIINNNKLLLFCGCGSYSPEYLIRSKLMYDIYTKFKLDIY